MAPLFDWKIKGFGVFNLICRAKRLNALNSWSVPTLPCCLGIWPLFINTLLCESTSSSAESCYITCIVIDEGSWRAMALAVIDFAQMRAVILVTRGMSEASSSPATFPLSAHHSFYNAVKGSRSSVNGLQLSDLSRGDFESECEDLTSSLSTCLDITGWRESLHLVFK